MARTNRVAPFETIAASLLNSNKSEISTSVDNDLSHAYLTLLRKHVSRKFCYHSDAATEAKIIQVNKRVAFQVDIWTLMERRRIKSNIVPYKGENAPGEEVAGDLFDETNYCLKTDSTVVKGNQIGSIVLDETQKKITCTRCQGQGKKTCVTCNNTGQVNGAHCSKCAGKGYLNCMKCSDSGFILRRSELHCKRYTLHSVAYPKNTFLPDKRIKKSTGKFTFFDEDTFYENDSFWSTFDSLESQIKNESPHDFCTSIEKQFKDNHASKTNKSTKIQRVKCTIQRIDIVEIDYTAGEYANKVNTQKGPSTFTFLLYGRGLKSNPEIYENDYALNACGCLGHACACRSKCCSIS